MSCAEPHPHTYLLGGPEAPETNGESGTVAPPTPSMLGMFMFADDLTPLPSVMTSPDESRGTPLKLAALGPPTTPGLLERTEILEELEGCFVENWDLLMREEDWEVGIFRNVLLSGSSVHLTAAWKHISCMSLLLICS